MKRGGHKGRDSRSPRPASALQINPLGPGMSIMPCSFLLCASDFSLAAGRRRCLFTLHLGTGGAGADHNDGRIKVQLKGKFENRAMEAQIRPKVSGPPQRTLVMLKCMHVK